jgi:YD repeat-containing protein
MVFATFRSFHTIMHRCLAGAVLGLLLSLPAAAQSSRPTDGSTPLGLSPGAPAGSYGLSGFDNVNLYNGGLNFHLPLLNIGGRGGAGYTMMLPIEQKWQVETYSFSYPDCWNDGGCGTVTETHYYPDPEWWDLLKPGYGPGVMHVRRGQWLKNNCNTPSGSPPRARFTLTRLTFTLPDGTEYDFVDQLTGGQKTILSTCATSGTNRGTVFVTTDGTAATFISDTNIYDDYLAGESWNSNDVAGYLIMRDGTRYRIDAGQVTWLRDRNGNKVTFTNSGIGVTTITDSLNRQITVEYNVNEGGQYGVCDRITYKGFGGANRVLRVSKTALGNVLRAGSSLQTYAYLFPGLEGSLYDYFNPTVVSDVWLPDNRRYQFRYNSYGELARVVLPTGGAVEYDHAAGLSDTANPGGVIDNGSTKNIYRRVLERREYPDGVNLSQKMTYSRWEGSGSGTGAVTVEQLDAGGVRLTKQKHYFHGNGADQSLFGHTPVDYPAWDEGREYQTEVFDTNGTTILRRTNNTWQGNGTLGGRTVNPRVVESGGTLEPAGANLVAKQTFAHDAYNNQTDVYEYDYGTGVAGALVRRTHTDYLTANPVNGSNYATDNNIHIRSLPAQSSVYDAGGTEVARATYEYDNYASDAYHTALTGRANLSGFDAAFNVSYTTRGNPTKASQWLLPAGTAISAYSQYDIAGNVVKTIDPKGHAANIYYDDNFGAPNGEAQTNTAPLELSSAGQTSYGFPTRAVNALGHTAYTQFDYYLGRPVEGEDANGVIANGAYNDPLDRPTQAVAAVNKPNKMQVSFAYDDANRLITTTRDLNAFNDNAIKSQVLYDKLGRTVETRLYESATAYVTAKQNYDALGRVYQASNPYRTGEPVVWATTTFDALGRVLSVTTPDGAVASTSYNGNTVTVSDPNGKQRKSVTDALGRLTTIYEDPNGLN